MVAWRGETRIRRRCRGGVKVGGGGGDGGNGVPLHTCIMSSPPGYGTGDAWAFTECLIRSIRGREGVKDAVEKLSDGVASVSTM